MRRYLCGVLGALLLATTAVPHPLAADAPNCFWWWTGSLIEIYPDGTIIETAYFEWRCDNET